MSKEKSVKWWIPFVLLFIVVGGTTVYVFSKQTPKYKYPKELSTYNTNTPNKSPDDAVNSLFRAINTEDVSLLKKCTDEKLVNYVYKQAKEKNNREGNDEDLKALLHSANESMKKSYGDEWYSKGVFIKQVRTEGSAAVEMHVRFKEQDKEKVVFSSAFKGEYTVIGGSAYTVLTAFSEIGTVSK